MARSGMGSAMLLTILVICLAAIQSAVAFTISNYAGDCNVLNFTLRLDAGEYTASDAYSVSITTPTGENKYDLFDFIGPDPTDPLLSSSNLKAPITITWNSPFTTGGNSTWQFALYNGSKLIDFKGIQDSLKFMWPIYCAGYTVPTSSFLGSTSTTQAAVTTTGVSAAPVATTTSSVSNGNGNSGNVNGNGSGNANGNSNGDGSGNSNGNGNSDDNSNDNGNGNSSDDNSGGSSNVGAIAGGVAGGVVALVVLALLAFCLLRKNKKQKQQHAEGGANGPLSPNANTSFNSGHNYGPGAGAPAMAHQNGAITPASYNNATPGAGGATGAGTGAGGWQLDGASTGAGYGASAAAAGLAASTIASPYGSRPQSAVDGPSGRPFSASSVGHGTFGAPHAYGGSGEPASQWASSSASAGPSVFPGSQSQTTSQYAPSQHANLPNTASMYSNAGPQQQPFAGAVARNPLLAATLPGDGPSSAGASAGAGAGASSGYAAALGVPHHEALDDDGLPAYDAGDSSMAAAPEKAHHVHPSPSAVGEGSSSAAASGPSSDPSGAAPADVSEKISRPSEI